MKIKYMEEYVKTVENARNEFEKESKFLKEENERLKQEVRLLNEMLDIAIAAMNENELCSYCRHNNYCNRNVNDDICMNGISGGLENIAMANLTQK